MPKKKSLNPQVDAFCIHFTTLGEDTYSRKGASAIAAGYSEKSARISATGLLKKPEVRQRIQELNEANFSRNFVTIDKTLSDLEHTRLLAVKKGDLAVAAKCSELHGKFLGCFTDRHIIDSPALAEFNKAEEEEIAELARLRVEQMINVRRTTIHGGDGDNGDD